MSDKNNSDSFEPQSKKPRLVASVNGNSTVRMSKILLKIYFNSNEEYSFVYHSTNMVINLILPFIWCDTALKPKLM